MTHQVKAFIAEGRHYRKNISHQFRHHVVGNLNGAYSWAIAALVKSHDPITGLRQWRNEINPHRRGYGKAVQQYDEWPLVILQTRYTCTKLTAIGGDAYQSGC